MSTLLRNEQPPLRDIAFHSIPEPVSLQYGNGLKLHLLEGGSQEVAKVDFIFPAGSVQAAKSLVASTVNTVLAEGTRGLTSVQVSEKLDYYGAYLWQYTNYHYSVFTFFCLSRHLPEVLPLIEEVIKYPVFPQEELDIFWSRRKQEFLVDQQKVKVLSARKFQKTLFGDSHPYSNILELAHFDAITRADVVDFHQQSYTPAGAHIVAAGLPGKEFGKLMERHFGQQWTSSSLLSDAVPVMTNPGGIEVMDRHDWAIQSSVRIGRPLFNRAHPDFIGLTILNTILGGYFGSRLMSNIREEKGLTYGIGSSIVPLKYGGYWTISTEVKAENRTLAVDEIRKEMQKLRAEAVSAEELALVKNYLVGEMIRTFDGPLATSDQFRGQLVGGLKMDYFDLYYHELMTMTPERLQQLAVEYLNPADFMTVVSGK